MKCLIAGTGSDIAKELTNYLRLDGWEVSGSTGHSLTIPNETWDLLILAHGTMEPIGKFFDCKAQEWTDSLMVNALYPLTCLRMAWHKRNPKATVVFIGGPNMHKDSPTYTAYRAGKAILEFLIGTLNTEYPDIKFRILHPGVVKTKIHEQTLNAGAKAANYIRAFQIVNGVETTIKHDEVYRRLKALL